ncbi:MAG TPA: hypothetical protein VFO19_10660 [Vicinamibacterales bacterium]|nr:hypothetical protein [Vicinamibacterales bacterium]
MKTAHSTSAANGRLRRRLFSTLLALAVFAGTIVGTARPAHAATLVFGCFRTAQGNQTLAAGTPVYLVIWIGNRWYNTGVNFPMDGSGCVWMPTNLYADYPQALYVNTGSALGTFTGGGTFWGFSEFYATPGSGFADLGTGLLYYSCSGRVNAC